MRSPSFIIRSSCDFLSKEGRRGCDIEPVISFPVLEVLPCFQAVRRVNKDKGIVLNKVVVQSKHIVSSLRKQGQIEPELLLLLSLFCYLQLFCELSWRCRCSATAVPCFCPNSIWLHSMVIIVQVKSSFASQMLMAAFFYVILNSLLCYLASPSILIRVNSSSSLQP